MDIKLYRVGGFVRDAILGVKSKDLDYAVVAPSYDAMVAYIRSQGEIYLESPEFWTVRAHIKGKLPADFVLCRKDSAYSDGRRPDSVSVGTLHDDLSRRDFTMNAIAVDDVSGEYIDPFNGIDDIELGVIRCVGKAYDRFFEDSLRLLRAIRFKITKGFALDKDIVNCLMNPVLTRRLYNVSDERKREELHKCFAKDTVATLSTLSQYNLVLDAVFGSKKLWLMPTMREV